MSEATVEEGLPTTNDVWEGGDTAYGPEESEAAIAVLRRETAEAQARLDDAVQKWADAVRARKQMELGVAGVTKICRRIAADLKLHHRLDTQTGELLDLHETGCLTCYAVTRLYELAQTPLGEQLYADTEQMALVMRATADGLNHFVHVASDSIYPTGDLIALADRLRSALPAWLDGTGSAEPEDTADALHGGESDGADRDLDSGNVSDTDEE